MRPVSRRYFHAGTYSVEGSRLGRASASAFGAQGLLAGAQDVVDEVGTGKAAVAEVGDVARVEAKLPQQATAPANGGTI
ncbi:MULTISPECIES: hypothetical protein [Streptomyces]|nr:MULTISPECIES: hypothetical protein [Streptomyces]UUS33917.1 hypothetical protein NRO40_25900 [Streptomyces changanensis]